MLREAGGTLTPVPREFKVHKALIVDDNSDIRSLLSRALKMEGFDVMAAENGEAARHLIQTVEKPCVILLDLMMPVMDGKQFLDWKNQQSHLDDVPVVIISALTDNSLQGVRAALKKPIDLTELFEVVDELCA
jgi:two-component system, chemotaxis family, chemotaxis protein CheY